MSNYAALIAPLVISGSRKSDGTPNASGTVYFYQPGTNTAITVYADAAASSVVTQPITLDAGGRINYSTYPQGVYTTQPVRLYVQDSAGAVVSDTVYVTSTAGNTGVSNTGFTDSTIDAVLSKSYASTGGVDFQFLESSGATPRLIQDRLREVFISVKDFGAKGDGITIDTSAFQAALNRIKALGGGTFYMPPTSAYYKIDQAITGTSINGLNIVGAGPSATAIRQTNGAADCFTLTSCDSLALDGFIVQHASTSSGNAITLSTCTNVIARNVRNNINNYTIGLNVSGSSSSTHTYYNCFFFGNGGSGRGLKTVAPFTSIISGAFGASSGAGVEFTGACTDVMVLGATFSSASAPTAFLFNAALTGTRFTILGCTSLATIATPFDLSGLSTDPKLKQLGNGIEGITYSSAIGGTLQILLQYGYDAILVAASGGAGTMTVSAPTPTPAAVRGTYMVTHFKNASGGAVTWSLNIVFVANAAIPTTDGHTISVGWYWDTTTNKWREMWRQDTV